jgi:hypothetical protein
VVEWSGLPSGLESEDCGLLRAGQPHVAKAIAATDEQAWVTLEDYPKSGVAQIAETTLSGRRIVVRRVRTLGTRQPQTADPGSALD